jgi:N-acetylmuramoyl-L-alanine amidase
MTLQRPYRRGDTGPAIAEIRTKLVTLGLLPPASGPAPVLDARFDDAMDRAVRLFQQQRGISVDGSVGPETYRLLDEARWRLGDRILSFAVSHPLVGDDVAELQRLLLDKGFDCGRVNGIYDLATERAVRDFQRNVGLPADGTCGPATLKTLDRLARTVVGGQLHAMRESEAIRRSGPALSGKLVVVDPGHGGDDPGVSANGLTEAEVVWDVAARVEGRLEAMGAQCYLTRGATSAAAETGGRTPLRDDVARAQFANSSDADLVISLHCDSHSHPTANGIATYYYGHDRFSHFSAAGQKFAGLVQREIVARTDLTNCGSHAMTWDLLRRTRMPSVRIELGYLTNPGDASRLSSASFRDHVAEGIVVAVQRLYLPPESDAPTGKLRLPQFT